MSFTTARRQLVSIIEDVSPSLATLFSAGARFKHLAEGRGGLACTSRSFWLEANVEGDGGITGPFTPDLAGQPRQTFTVSLTVSYRDHPTKRATLDEVLAADQRSLSIALLDPSLWDRANSGIISITTDAAFLPWRRTYLSSSVEMRTLFSLYFR